MKPLTTSEFNQAGFWPCLAAVLLSLPANSSDAPLTWQALSDRTRARMLEMDEIIRDRDPERSYASYLELFANDVIVHGLLDTGDTGMAGLREHYRAVFFELRDGVLLSDDVIVAGNMAAQRYHSLLYVAGEFDGVKGDMQPVFLRGQTFFRFDEENQIAQRWSNHDHGYRLGQLQGDAGRRQGDRLARRLNGPGLTEAEVYQRLGVLIDVFNRMESPATRLAEFADVLSDDVIIHGLAEGGVGGDVLVATLRDLWSAFPDLQVTISAQLSAWSMGAIRWKALGSHRAIYRDRQPDMRPASLCGEAIMRFDRGGQVTELWLHHEPIDFGA